MKQRADDTSQPGFVFPPSPMSISQSMEFVLGLGFGFFFLFFLLKLFVCEFSDFLLGFFGPTLSNYENSRCHWQYNLHLGTKEHYNCLE